MGRSECAWSLLVTVIIVRQGPALYFQQVTGSKKRCDSAWSLSVPARVVVGQGPALCFQQVTGAIGRYECA